MQTTLVDTGPLVAVLDRSDAHHQSCREALKRVPAPLVTVWHVLTEAMHLLAFSWEAQGALWGLLDSGGVALATLTADDAPRIRWLMEKYRDLPMDLADAALVRVAEREHISRVLTTDHVDFLRYRPEGVGMFEILPTPKGSPRARRRRSGRMRKRVR